jgi:uncharacterized protein (DUF1697 family)
MHTYISILRGINVGHKVIKMDQLRALYESVGFTDVRTYIQSGNVIFSTRSESPSAIRKTIEEAINKSFGFPVTVIIREPAELRKVIKGSPFVGRKTTDETRLHVTFLDQKPAPSLVKALEPLAAKTKDEYSVKGKEVYLHCPDGYGTTLLSNAFFEKHLRVSASTRNWKTVNTVFALSTGPKE